ncbi:hypothetical protein QWY85_11275 [Neolewinella lacunae]|uniref:Uncharacterized protein n=1 Tax=Neolewinella lacunae TaxID=1517758 RepID=A0A923PNI6_9BACT|nr:hypothetical protein [Neolewinella lacunae]MBC6993757.1 hypothetical protein [Neolewinella lacunae]MDN3635242.1 hypothetical protein [Neolewinella lacunae]
MEMVIDQGRIIAFFNSEIGAAIFYAQGFGHAGGKFIILVDPKGILAEEISGAIRIDGTRKEVHQEAAGGRVHTKISKDAVVASMLRLAQLQGNPTDAKIFAVLAFGRTQNYVGENTALATAPKLLEVGRGWLHNLW